MIAPFLNLVCGVNQLASKYLLSIIKREHNMKRILLLAFLAVSTLAGTTSLSNEAQAAGINGDPEPRIWMCVYKLHSVVRVRNA